ncbi:hypothetical protein RchiOBHm_Chr5g0057491 [Rosa chinensis]|uniref:Uncharacterized protein n=1 Tax=Rosa chinensis TaxID=74649 RepID=A0A2P6QGX4_ROSCH|nr:hypothetical protein RchiOBHm_Chr5g0057491 [Rosa chinensis]
MKSVDGIVPDSKALLLLEVTQCVFSSINPTSPRYSRRKSDDRILLVRYLSVILSPASG